MITLLAPLVIGLKTTGLQFGYFFGLLCFAIFLIRGIRDDRKSDILLGWIMFFMAMLLQDYTFGFAGINFLWEEMDGWPRSFPWIFPACVYFYFLAQTNVNFTFKRSDIIHLVPYFLYLILSLWLYLYDLTPRTGLYSNGSYSGLWHAFFQIISFGGIFYYFIKSLKIYKSYKVWAENQFSNVYDMELKWLRNFLIFFLVGSVLHLINTIIDVIYNLPFDQDYYWQLFIVITIVYVGISSLTQKQEKNLAFTEEAIEDIQEETKAEHRVASQEELDFKDRLESFMKMRKPYLNPDLTLKNLASQMNTNVTFLSGVINSVFEKNFNDFINEARVNEFQIAKQNPENKNLTLIAIAYDCGFNSKATFNRAIKKFTGKMPSEL
jgi:AraC-like DNA-binding protein